MPKTLALKQSEVMESWNASLKLAFTSIDNRTVLSSRQHNGPLVVQKTLYPEGDDLAHLIILHPPGGVAGGDELRIDAELNKHSKALLTTPGATKWYKANGRLARQDVRFDLSEQALLEWFPQENIIFDGANVAVTTTVNLSDSACFAGWDITVLGRQAGEAPWQSGCYRQAFDIYRENELIWSESIALQPDSLMLESVAGLRGQKIFGSFVITAQDIPDALLEKCRHVNTSKHGMTGVSQLNHVFAARYIGACSQEAKQYFEALWTILRPWYAQKKANRPRIWST